MAAKIACLQHAPFEGPGAVARWAGERGHLLHPYNVYENDFPDPSQYSGLLVMGGPMGVRDLRSLDWLRAEVEFIRSFLDSAKPILGICLGAQLIAHAMGAEVTRNKELEIGWFEIEKTKQAANHPLFAHFPERFTVFHWHGDCFSLPPGCTRLAFNSITENQAFAGSGRVLGLQFHIEIDPESTRMIVEGAEEELAASPNVQGKLEILAGARTHFPVLEAHLFRMLDLLYSG